MSDGDSMDREAASLAGTKEAIYLVPVDVPRSRRQLGLSLDQIVGVLWMRKWGIGLVTLGFMVVAAVYALLATQWFKAETTLKPADVNQGISAQLGSLAGLAGLAGINIGQGGDAVEAMAVLGSREFQSAFITDLGLTKELIEASSPRIPFLPSPKLGADGKPDIREALKVFNKLILNVSQDRKTGLVTLSVAWKDPVVAAEWANLLVERVNDQMRERAAREATENIQFLRSELQTTTLVPLQQSIGSVLEREYQSLMLARGNREFAFRVIDPATPPKWRAWPRRTLTVALAALLGFSVALALVLLKELRSVNRAGHEV